MQAATIKLFLPTGDATDEPAEKLLKRIKEANKSKKG